MMASLTILLVVGHNGFADKVRHGTPDGGGGLQHLVLLHPTLGQGVSCQSPRQQFKGTSQNTRSFKSTVILVNYIYRASHFSF